MDIIKTHTFFFYLVGALLVFIIGLVAVSTFFITKATSNADTNVLHSISLNGRSVNVTIVDTSEGRERGLSGRTNLASDGGMLFIFPSDGKYQFWMKDMKFSIDIVWISAEKEIVDIRKSVFPESFPEVFTPKAVARYVLELPAGFTDAEHTNIGDKVVF